MFKSIALLASLITTTAFSMNEYDQQYYTVDEMLVSEISEVSGEKIISRKNLRNRKGSNFVLKSAQQGPGLGEIIAQAESIIALGKEIYKIVEAGKPVVSYDSTPISVLPMNAERSGPVSAFDLENWRSPFMKKYKVTFKNLLGMEVVTFQWSIVYSYGGQVDGKGAYITGAQIKAEKIDVAWGYTFNAGYKLQSLSNLGSKTNPVAQATIGLEFKVETVLKTMIRGETYSITGLGQSKILK